MNKQLKRYLSDLHDSPNVSTAEVWGQYILDKYPEDLAHIIIFCVDALTIAERGVFISLMDGRMSTADKLNSFQGNFNLADDAPIEFEATRYLLKVTFNKYNFEDWQLEQDQDKALESESDQNIAEYENQSMNRRV